MMFFINGWCSFIFKTRNNCAYHKAGSIIPCSLFEYKLDNGETAFHGQIKVIALFDHFGINESMEKLFLGQMKMISLLIIKMLFIFQFAELAAVFILDKLKILNKELWNINKMSKTCITALAGHAKNILETTTKPSHFLKYFHSIVKQILPLVAIKKNDAFSNGNLH